MCGTRRSPRSPRAPKPISPASSRLCRMLRPGQSAPHQRPLRCHRSPRARARHRGADTVRRDRRRLFPGNPSADLFQECSDYCELVTAAAQCRDCSKTPSGGGRQARRGRRGDPWRCRAQYGPRARRISSPGLIPPLPVVQPDAAELERSPACSTGRPGDHAVRPGCQGAHDQLLASRRAAESADGACAQGKEHVEWDNPYSVGMTGLIGFSSGYYAMHSLRRC